MLDFALSKSLSYKDTAREVTFGGYAIKKIID